MIVAFLLLSQNLHAEVWASKNSWNRDVETQYVQWIQSKLTFDIFSNPNGPYYGIKTDCADAAAALRTIFAYEHQLPVYFKDNDGLLITNSSSKYDHLTNKTERLKAFLRDMGENIGSETLASDNTYPIALSNIRPGDVYITKWTDASGIDTRHVYIVKDILPTGDLLLFSSTQPRAIRPLLARKGMPSHIISGEPYGFKRFSSGPKFDHPEQSFSQYDDLKNGERFYFGKIKETHQKVKDTFENNINQRIENICMALQTRVHVVNLALEEFEKNNRQCFSHDEYDEYSTPSRDHNIVIDIQSLIFGWKTIKQRQIEPQLSEKLQSALEYLSGNISTDESRAALNSFCQLSEIQNSLDIRFFYDRFKAGAISSNPNESKNARWGLERESGICPKR